MHYDLICQPWLGVTVSWVLKQIGEMSITCTFRYGLCLNRYLIISQKNHIPNEKKISWTALAASRDNNVAINLLQYLILTTKTSAQARWDSHPQFKKTSFSFLWFLIWRRLEGSRSPFEQPLSIFTSACQNHAVTNTSALLNKSSVKYIHSILFYNRYCYKSGIKVNLPQNFLQPFTGI